LTLTGIEGREKPEPDRLLALGLVGSVPNSAAEPSVVRLLAASIVLFGPLLLLAALRLDRERRTGRARAWGTRLWLRPMKGGDGLWAVGVLTAGDGSTDLHLLLREYIHPHLDQFKHLALSRKVYLLQAALDTFGTLK
jgi:hypothetical protein